jgi:hypothetical protein
MPPRRSGSPRHAVLGDADGVGVPAILELATAEPRAPRRIATRKRSTTPQTAQRARHLGPSRTAALARPLASREGISAGTEVGWSSPVERARRRSTAFLASGLRSPFAVQARVLSSRARGSFPDPESKRPGAGEVLTRVCRGCPVRSSNRRGLTREEEAGLFEMKAAVPKGGPSGSGDTAIREFAERRNGLRELSTREWRAGCKRKDMEGVALGWWEAQHGRRRTNRVLQASEVAVMTFILSILLISAFMVFVSNWVPHSRPRRVRARRRGAGH